MSAPNVAAQGGAGDGERRATSIANRLTTDPVDSTIAPAPPAPPPSAGIVARVASVAALVAAVVVVVLVLFGGGSSYTLKADFQDAGGLVAGDDVLIGPARVGSVQSIGLTDNGQAQVVIGLNSGVGPMPDGTIARVYENSLSGIANKYVVLQPGDGARNIPSGAVIPSTHTYSEVSLDEVFNAIDGRTRNGLRGFVRGQAASIQGRAPAANRTLKYLAPGLVSTTNLTAEITRDEPAFDGLVVHGAQALSALAVRSAQLTQLIANTNTTASAIARQGKALEQALVLLPNALTRTTSTLGRLNTTLSSLEPLVDASKPAVRRLPQFAVALRHVIDVGTPTIGLLNDLIRNPAGTGDLTSLLRETPSLVALTTVAFPHLIEEMNKSQHQLDYLREYAPDVIASLANLGQASSYYDANGHYTRTQPVFNAFGISASNQLVARPPSLRNVGLQRVSSRCPGGAIQPSPDGSAPWQVPGCDPATTPPGP